MLSDTTIKRLNTISKISLSGKKINGLFRLMESHNLWKQAYANLGPNKDAITKGIDDVTSDGFSEKRINYLISRMKSGNYDFKPVRRTYLPKKNGTMCPLGILNGDDKLIQEVVRIILNQTYECCFSNNSYGFRENRTCHTALMQVKQTWTTAKWFIKMDIKGLFDIINHDKMLEILEKKIDDKRFLNLIASMLKAGYMNDFKFYRGYSGTPQVGVISSILANIYLNELDYFIMGLIREFNENTYGCPNEANYRKLHYNRYVDNFILGVVGSKRDAYEIADNIRKFVVEELHLEIVEDTFTIRHASYGVNYLGYKVISYSGNKSLKLKERIQLIIPNEKLQKFAIKNGYGDMYHHKPNSRPMLTHLSDAEIISIYNAELRGIVNYYSLGNSVHRKLEPLVSLARSSCAITLAHKHKSTANKMISDMKRTDGEWVRKVEGTDRIYEYRIYRLHTDARKKSII